MPRLLWTALVITACRTSEPGRNPEADRRCPREAPHAYTWVVDGNADRDTLRRQSEEVDARVHTAGCTQQSTSTFDTTIVICCR